MKPVNTSKPPISVVVIGLNVAPFLEDCLHALKKSRYPQDKLEIIYADSGSTDGSQLIASRFDGVKLVEMKTGSPSAAKGRNLGAEVATHDIIQFVDADSYLHPDWLGQAVKMLNENVAAVAGTLRERFPTKNIFHQMADLEWNLRVGPRGWTTSHVEAKTFGGNVMMQAEVFRTLRGYDEKLRAGEDPDMSYRLRQLGKKILRLNVEMASHDINIDTLGKFLKRTKRSGYAYTQLAWRYIATPERYMANRVMRILVSGSTPLGLLILGWVYGQLFLGSLLALLFAFRLVFKAGKYARMFGIKTRHALMYSLYLTLAIYPQYLGLLQAARQILFEYLRFGRMNKTPLSGGSKSLRLNTLNS